VIAITGSRSSLVYRPLPADDPRQRRPDLRLAHSLLGDWVARTSLDEGLRRTAAYFQTRLAASTSSTAA